LRRSPKSLNTPGRDRTCDLRFRKPSLYPLSYGGEVRFALENKGFCIRILREGERGNKDSQNPPKTRDDGDRRNHPPGGEQRPRLPAGHAGLDSLACADAQAAFLERKGLSARSTSRGPLALWVPRRQFDSATAAIGNCTTARELDDHLPKPFFGAPQRHVPL
jgi:hypothetical protein